MNPIAIWCKFKDYGKWCYQYRIPDITEFIDGFEYEYINFMITRFNPNEIEVYWKQGQVNTPFGLYEDETRHLGEIQSYLNSGHIRVLKDDIKIDMKVDKDDIDMKEGIYESTYQWYTIYNSTGHKVTCLGPSENIQIDLINKFKKMNIIKNESKKEYEFTIKSKYKLNPNLIEPDLKILSKLYEKKDKIISILKKIIPKFLTIIDNVNKYPKRFISIKEGWKPLHTLDEINNNLYNHQPEKSPNRLVFITTKDKKKCKRITWRWANYLISKFPDKYEFISKEEGRKLQKSKFRIEPPKVKYNIKKFRNREESRRPLQKKTFINHNTFAKSKRSHPGRIKQSKKKVSEYIVTLTKRPEASSINGPETLTRKVFTTSEKKAENQARKHLFEASPNRIADISKVVLKTIEPYYKAVVKRSPENDTIVHPKGDRSTLSLLEAKKQVLITKTKSGDKKIEEIITYQRKYPKLHPPWKIHKKWRCLMDHSKKYLSKKIEEEKKKLVEEMKLKKQNKRIIINKKKEKILV